MKKLEPLVSQSQAGELAGKDFFALHQLINTIGSFEVTRISYQMGLSTGTLSLIRDDELKKILLGYYEYESQIDFYEDAETKWVNGLNAYLMSRYLFGSEADPAITRDTEFKNLILANFSTMGLKIDAYRNLLKESEKVIKTIQQNL